MSVAFAVSAANLVYWWVASTNGKGLGAVFPMPPVTAIAFLVLAGGFGVVLIFPEAHWAKRWLAALSAAASAAVLTAVLPRLLPGFPDWESVFDPARLTFLGAPAGGSRFEAVFLVAVTGFNLCTMVLAPQNSRAWKIGAVSSVLSALLGFLTLVADTAGNPMFSGAGLLGVSPPAAIAFLLLNAGLTLNRDLAQPFRAWLAGAESAGAVPASWREDRVAWQFFGVLGCVAIVAVTYLRIQTRARREEIGDALIADVGLKTAQVVKWRREREGDATTIWSAPGYREATSTFVATGLTPEQRKEFEEVTASFIRAYGYRRLTSFDRQMRPVYSLPDEPDLTPDPLQMLLKGGVADGVVETPVYLDRSGTLLWGYLVRIRRRYSEETGAYVLLQKELQELFPYLQAWPKDNVTGRTLLWARKGNTNFLLGGIRDTPGTPATLRQPFAEVRQLDQPGTNGARIAAGETGVIEGPDAGGRWILLAGRLVPNSGWTLTSSMSGWEVYAPLRRTSWMVVSFSSVLLGLVGFVTTRFWRDQQRQLINERLLADVDRKRTATRLGLVMQNAKDVILVLDEDMRIIEANDQAMAVYGWSRDELIGMPVRNLRAAETVSDFEQVAQSVASSTGAIFETVHRRRDGSTLPVDVSARQMETDGEKQILSIIRDISDRKRAEAELRVSEERYRLIAENTSDIIWLYDFSRQGFIYVSAAAYSMLGYRPEELLGVELTFTLTEDSGAKALAIVDQLLAEFRSGAAPRHAIVELDQRRKDGRIVPTEVVASVVAGPSGGAGHILGITRDITERKQAEEAFRVSEERYRSIISVSNTGGWEYRVNTAYLWGSPEYFSMLGRRQADYDLSGKPNLKETWIDLLHPEDRKRAADHFAEYLRNGSVGIYESYFRLQHQNGDWAWIWSRGQTLRDADGKVTNLTVGTHIDITERKRAEEKLRQLSTIIEQAPLSVVITDLTGLIEYVNPKFCTVTGYGKEDVLGKDVRALRSSELQQEVYRGMWQAVTDNHVWSGEMRSRKKNGDIYLENVVVAPLVDPNGRATHFVALKDDITAQKRFEAEATAKLAKEREVSEMKSQFISVASHEFRTPLAAAVGSLELLERHAAKLTEAKRVELISRIQRSLSRLTTIMNDVLQLSRADSGRVKVKRMAVDVGRFVQDIIHEVKAGNGEKHRFEFQRTGGPDVVFVDTNLVNHILSNLVGNAVRYSAAGTTVTVELAIADEAFTIRVRDEGIGIPETDRQRVFEPFVRGSNVGQIGGTGLGLNIVKRYTELMGGRIELLPSTQGTVFQVMIPFQQSPTS